MLFNLAWVTLLVLPINYISCALLTTTKYEKNTLFRHCMNSHSSWQIVRRKAKKKKKQTTIDNWLDFILYTILVRNSGRNKHHIKPPQSFKGDEKPHIDDFLNQFERYCQFAHYDEEDTLLAFPSYLEGSALRFYETLTANVLPKIIIA